MTDAPSMNPVSVALSIVLSGATGIHIVDYADTKTFAGLWFNGLEAKTPEIAGEQLDWNDKSTLVIIVGEDPPDEIFTRLLPCLKGINFRDHLTATSWVAAWRLKFPDAKARVIVLASRTSEASSSIAQAISTIVSARTANDSPLVPGVGLLRSPSLEILCRNLQVGSGPNSKPTRIVQSMLRATIWDGLTADREGHHAVSNVLGGLLLSSQVGRGNAHPGEPWAQDYLLALVQACGVGTSSNQVTLNENQGFQCWISPQLQQDIGAAVFIDDMADIWEFFLRGALGFVGDRKFPGTDRTLRESFVTSPRTKFYDEIQGLPDRLKSVLGSGSQLLPASTLISGEHRIEKDFVLFLDLRLFPKRGSTDGDLQVPFFKQLAEFGFALLDSGRNLPWLDEDGKKLLRKELEQFAGSTSPQPSPGPTPTLPPEETLLPRLLSLLDPTLPIIIFSSTHRTDLTEPFRNYGNIITTFRKPILTGMTRNWAEVVKELHADFTSALEQATRILRVRALFRPFY